MVTFSINRKLIELKVYSLLAKYIISRTQVALTKTMKSVIVQMVDPMLLKKVLEAHIGNMKINSS